MEGLERWKARHAAVWPKLEPADVLVDAMRGRSSVWYRIRLNLQHVPEAERPSQEPLEIDYDPWAGLQPWPGWQVTLGEGSASPRAPAASPATPVLGWSRSATTPMVHRGCPRNTKGPSLWSVSGFWPRGTAGSGADVIRHGFLRTQSSATCHRAVSTCSPADK